MTEPLPVVTSYAQIGLAVLVSANTVALAADMWMRFADRRRLKQMTSRIEHDHAEIFRLHAATLDYLSKTKASSLSAARASERTEHKVDDAAVLAAGVAGQLEKTGGPVPVIVLAPGPGSGRVPRPQ